MGTLAYILSPKLSDAGVVQTGSTTVENGGVANVQNLQPRLRTVFTSGSCYIEGDLGATYSLDSLCIGFINSQDEDDTFRVRVKNSYPVTSSPLYDSTDKAIWNPGSDLSAFYEVHRQYEFGGVFSARYWRVDFNCSIPVEVGRLFVGLKVEPVHTVNVIENDSDEPVSESIDLGGQRTRRPMGGAVRSVHLEWPTVTKQESLAYISEFAAERGSGRDFMIAAVHGDDEIVAPMQYVWVGCGKFKVRTNSLTQNRSATLDLIEMAPVRMR